jgi:hypothetical protein
MEPRKTQAEQTIRKHMTSLPPVKFQQTEQVEDKKPFIKKALQKMRLNVPENW